MKTSLSLSVICAALLILSGGVLAGKAFADSADKSAALGKAVVKLDTTTSSISWVGKKVTGQHSGTVAVKGGEALLDGSNLVGGSFEVDLGSIRVTDITDPKDNAKLTNHLKSGDFFGSDLFPTATLTITQAKRIQNAKAGEANYDIAGDVTIKGLKNTVNFPAIVTVANGRAEAKATFTLDRTKWNMRYGSGQFFENLGDKLIYDDFEVTMSVSGPVSGPVSGAAVS